jgi:ankyrin repeat protein
MEVLRYKLDIEGGEDRSRASNLFWDFDDDKDTLENLFKNETKSVKTAAFNMWPLYYPGADFIETMLRIGADPNYSDCDNWSLLDLVLNQGNDEALRILLSYKPEMKITNYVSEKVQESGSELAKDVVKRCERRYQVYEDA